MRFTAICAAFSYFLLGLGIVQAGDVPDGGQAVKPKAVTAAHTYTGTTTVNSGTLVLQAQAVPAQGVVPVQGHVLAGQGTLTITAEAMAAPTSTSVDSNGTRQTQSEEYGLKVKITDDPKKGIKIERTTHKGGTEETKSYEAKDARELEKKSPEAFKLYQKYLGEQVTAGGGVILGGTTNTLTLQGANTYTGVLTTAGPGGAKGMPIGVATELMGELSGDIDAAAKNSAWKDATKDERAAIKKQAEELQKRLGKLAKELEE